MFMSPIPSHCQPLHCFTVWYSYSKSPPNGVMARMVANIQHLTFNQIQARGYPRGLAQHQGARQGTVGSRLHLWLLVPRAILCFRYDVLRGAWHQRTGRVENPRIPSYYFVCVLDRRYDYYYYYRYVVSVYKKFQCVAHLI